MAQPKRGCKLELAPAGGLVVAETLLPPVGVARKRALQHYTMALTSYPAPAATTLTLTLLDGSDASFVLQWQQGWSPPSAGDAIAALQGGEARVVVRGKSRPAISAKSAEANLQAACAAVAPLSAAHRELAFLLWALCTRSDSAETSPRYVSEGSGGLILVAGPTGVGKTASIKAVAASIGAVVVFLRDHTVEAVDAAFDEALRDEPAVVLIDDAADLFPTGSSTITGGDDDATMASPAIARIVRRSRQIKSKAVAVVVVSPEDERAVDKVIIEEVLDFVRLELPSHAEIIGVLNAVFAGTCCWSSDVDLNEVANRCRGFSLSDIHTLTAFALRHASASPLGSESTQTIVSIEAVNYGFARLEASTRRATETIFTPVKSKLGWNELHGMTEAKDELARDLLAPLRASAAVASALGVQPPRGFLVHGAPGTGKTALAKAVAGEAGLPLLELSLAAIAKGEVGESERAVQQLFESAARFRPAAVLLDDVDLVFGPRAAEDTTAGGIGSGVTSQLLLEIDRAPTGVIVLATTSLVDRVEPALLRPGRIDHHIKLTAPGLADRENIIRGTSVAASADLDWGSIAAATVGFTPSDLLAVNRRAIHTALSKALIAHPDCGTELTELALTTAHYADAIAAVQEHINAANITK